MDTLRDGTRSRPTPAARSCLGALVLLAGQCLPGPVAAQDGRVRVSYVAPERFTDADGWSSGRTLRATLAEMTHILEQLGQARLRPGESLDLTVLDIDLAGVERPGAPPSTILRVVTDATPPRIRLAYALRRSGRVVAQGEETVTDIDFLRASGPRGSTGDLAHERAVLRDWFAKRFPEPAGRGG